jgi:hypothetical protein
MTLCSITLSAFSVQYMYYLGRSQRVSHALKRLPKESPGISRHMSQHATAYIWVLSYIYLEAVGLFIKVKKKTQQNI